MSNFNPAYTVFFIVCKLNKIEKSVALLVFSKKKQKNWKKIMFENFCCHFEIKFNSSRQQN